MPLWRPGQKTRARRSEERLPPGQKHVKGWPVLHEGEVPDFDEATWRLTIDGEVDNPVRLSWTELQDLPRVETTQDFHCVTTWSRYDNLWGGVAVGALLDLVRAKPSARHVLAGAYDDFGYTTNLTLEDFARPQNLLATHHDGAPLTADHGGPIRLVVHHLYAWKSCKWLSSPTFLSEDQRGFWERNGYHNRADPWLEERFSYQE